MDPLSEEMQATSATSLSDADNELRTFRLRAKSALEPTLAELLSDETRKVQRSLLALSFALILLGLEAVRLSGTVREMGLEFSINAVTLLKVLLSVCLYFEVLVAIRCFTDWRLYRVRTSIAELDLDALANEMHTESRELAPEIARLATPIDETLEANTYRAARGWDEGDEAGMSSGTQLPQSDLTRRAEESLAQLRLRRAQLQAFISRSKWLNRQLSAVSISKVIRITWEIAFPLLFGAVALCSGAAEVFK